MMDKTSASPGAVRPRLDTCPQPQIAAFEMLQALWPTPRRRWSATETQASPPPRP